MRLKRIKVVTQTIEQLSEFYAEADGNRLIRINSDYSEAGQPITTITAFRVAYGHGPFLEALVRLVDDTGRIWGEWDYDDEWGPYTKAREVVMEALRIVVESGGEDAAAE